MWFNVDRFSWIWDRFSQADFKVTIKSYPGDQDYIGAALDVNQRRFFDDFRFESYRWQCLDGGYDFRKRRHNSPGTGTVIPKNTSVLVFHGAPKPADISDLVIQQQWI
jgi:hypothetical protein